MKNQQKEMEINDTNYPTEWKTTLFYFIGRGRQLLFLEVCQACHDQSTNSNDQYSQAEK
jgi:hypothetical protein